MADNTVVGNTTSQPNNYTVASDEVAVGGTQPVAQVQFVKLVDGSLNGTTPIAGGANGLKVDGSSVTQPVSNAGTFAVQDSEKVADNAAFTDGTTKVQPAGYIFDEVAGTPLTENDAAAARIDSKRAQVAVLEDATTRGQRATVSAAGALKVDGSAVTQPVSGTVTAAQATAANLNAEVQGDAAHDAPVSGNPVLTAGRASAAAPAAVSLDGDAVSAWHLLNGAAAAVLTAAGALIGGDAANGLDVDVTRVTGTVTVADASLDNATLVDNAAFADAVTRVLMAGHIFDETAGTALTENDAAASRVDSKRALVGVIEDATTRGQRVAVNAGGAMEVQGDVAHGVAIAGNPVAVGMRANANEPAVVADGNVTHGWADTWGRQVVVTGHPSPEPPVSLNATASGDTTVIAAPGASLSLYIVKASVHNRAATNRLVALRDGAAGTIRWRAELAAEGGGSLIDFGTRGWKLTANTLLAVNLDAAGDVDVNISEFYIGA